MPSRRALAPRQPSAERVAERTHADPEGACCRERRIHAGDVSRIRSCHRRGRFRGRVDAVNRAVVRRGDHFDDRPWFPSSKPPTPSRSTRRRNWPLSTIPRAGPWAAGSPLGSPIRRQDGRGADRSSPNRSTWTASSAISIAVVRGLWDFVGGRCRHPRLRSPGRFPGPGQAALRRLRGSLVHGEGPRPSSQDRRRDSWSYSATEADREQVDVVLVTETDRDAGARCSESQQRAEVHRGRRHPRHTARRCRPAVSPH